MHFWLLYLSSIFLLRCSFAFQNFEAAVRESDVEGLVGESVRLPCEVDKTTCGPFHSIKWYKENDRVFIFSEIAEVKRPEGSLLERTEFHYSKNRKENWLEIFPLKTEDEGTYKCEITYLAVKEACSVVQFVNLKTLARPISFELTFEDGSPILNGSTIGPFPEGEDVPLKCEAGGAKPVPSVKWLNGTEKIQGRFQSTVDDGGLFVGSNSIQLTPTRSDLQRKISCEVLNDAMKAPVFLWLQIDVDVAPKSVTIDIQKSVLREGEEVSLVCSAKGAKPVAQLKWKNGTIPIDEVKTNANIQEDTAEIKLSDGTYETRSRLVFFGTRYENDVPFTCEATNPILEKKRLPPISHSVKIDVQYAPTVLVSPENMTLNESMDFLLSCHYTANPSQLIHVYWYLDGHQLDVAGRPDKYKNGNIQYPSLFVVNASANDMGEYTCRVANQVGASEVTNSAYVNVQYSPEVVVLAEPEGPFSEDMKPNVTLYCDVIKAHPDTLTRVRWFSNGTLLKELPECVDNATALYDSQSELCNVDPSRLLLEYVMREFHGNYSCEGMNAAGWGERSAPVPVVVNYRPGQAMIEYYPDVVIKGEPVTLTCNSVDPGRPEASTFRWTRNSHLVPDVTTRDWKIDSASLETKANFTCVPINSEGEGGMASAVINVLARPTFITRLPTYHGALMNAHEVSLTCHVECSPNCSISWLKDNLPLENDTHYALKNVYLPPDFASGDFESVKSILSWKMEQWPGGKLHREIDNANYTCISSVNIAGDGVSSNTVFRVEYPPEGITISTKRLQVKEDEKPSKIKCSASSYPEPSYYWVHKGETVITGSILNLDFPIKRKRAGEYECVAENRHGKQKALTVLDILFKPECEIDRQDITVNEEAYLLLVCRAYANPEDVSFRWRFGNKTLDDSIEVNGLESRLTREALPESLGTYYCYVNNSVGESIPCEIDVTGVAGLLETLGDDNLLMYAIIAVAVIILIIIIIILIIFCRRQKLSGKYTGSGNLHSENNDVNINRGSLLAQNISSTSSTAATVSSQPLHKWPLKPGVQVHVNSLTSLADDSKPLFNLNTNTNSTTISSNSYQVQHPHDNFQHPLLSNLGSHSIQGPHAKLGGSLLLQRNFPSSTLDNKRSSSSSSSSSSSNLLNHKLSAIHTLPRQPVLNADVGNTRWTAVPVNAKPVSSYATKCRKMRPSSVLSEHDANLSPKKVEGSDRQTNTLPRTGKKKRSREKDSDPSKRDKGHKSETSGKDPPNGTKDNRPSSPYEEGPTFYENLPFHGIQAPPNKVVSSEDTKGTNVNTSSGSRPPSQLSQQTSSGYGSTRSQGEASKCAIKPVDESIVREITRKTKKDVSFQQDIDQDMEPKSSFDRRGSEPFGSMHRSSMKAARNALAKTAAYFSVRVPKKPNIFSKSQRNKNESSVSDVNDSPGEESNCDFNAPEKQSTEGNNNSTSTFLTTEASHSLNTKTSPHSFFIETTQTSTLTLHSGPKNEPNNNLNASGDTNINTDFSNKDEQMKWGTPKSNTHWAYSPPETSMFQKQSSYYSTSSLSDITPTPAPRNANIRPRPAYQNIPSSSKINTNTTPIECPIERPHEMHVLPVENRRKMLYEQNSKNPSINSYTATPPSSNASSPSSQYQQPYQSTYPSQQNYQITNPPTFNHYSTGVPVNPTIPPMYPPAGRYHPPPPPNYPNAMDRQYSSESCYSQPNSVHSYKNKYQQPIVYTDLNINHNGLPNNYKREHSTDYAVLQFNEMKGPVIGQEIDV